MLYLNETRARRNFKDLLGQANHFLITILIGLHGVETGQVTASPDFHAAWNPKDVKISARRSRAFALDLALIRAVDALDAYMSWSLRKPSIIQQTEFRSALDKAGNEVWAKFEAFNRQTMGLDPVHEALIHLGITWRNRRVHSLASNELGSKNTQILKKSGSTVAERFRGLSVTETLSRMQNNKPPAFKEAAGIVSAVQKAVELFDAILINRLDIEVYAKNAIRNELARDHLSKISLELHLERRASAIWSGTDFERTRRVSKVLELLGFSASDKYGYKKELPTPSVEFIQSRSPEQILLFLEG